MYCVDDKNELKEVLSKFKKLFKAVGRLNYREVAIELKKGATPIIQPWRRYPFHIRKRINTEIERLIKLGLVEKVKRPTKWLTPLVVVPKKNNTVRLCYI